MYTDKLFLVRNWKEIQHAEKMNLPNLPNEDKVYTKFICRNRDIKSAFIDEHGNIIIEFYDNRQMTFAYDERLWNELLEHLNSDPQHKAYEKIQQAIEKFSEIINKNAGVEKILADAILSGKPIHIQLTKTN